jgi:intracellular septation protein
MSEKTINPVLKQVLELGPPLLFFVAYLWVRDETFTIGGTDYEGFIVAAAGFVPILLASIAISGSSPAGSAGCRSSPPCSSWSSAG